MRPNKHLLGLPKGKRLFGTVKVGEKGQIVIPKEARELFGISPGDTLLVLGDEENGIFISNPEVLSDAANRIFEKLNRSHDPPDQDTDAESTEPSTSSQEDPEGSIT